MRASDSMIPIGIRSWTDPIPKDQVRRKYEDLVKDMTTIKNLNLSYDFIFISRNIEILRHLEDS